MTDPEPYSNTPLPNVTYTEAFYERMLRFVHYPQQFDELFGGGDAGVCWRIVRSYQHYLIGDSQGVVITQEQYAGLEGCVIYFRLQHQADGGLLLVFEDVLEPAPLLDEEDDTGSQ